MDFDIYSIGDPAFLAETLKATTVIMDRDGLEGIVAIGFLIGFIWLVVQGVLSGGSEIKIQNIIMAGLIYVAFFGVKVDNVQIWSKTTMNFHQVSDVPIGIAFTGTVISRVGNNLSEWFEQEYTAIGASTSDMGTGFALKALYEMRGLGFSDGSLKWDPNGHLTKSLTNYIKDCVVPGTTIPTVSAGGTADGLPAINLKKVVDSDSAWGHLKWDNKMYTTKVYPFLTNDPTPSDTTDIKTCAAAYDYITNEYVTNPDVINQWMKHIGESTCNEAGFACEAFRLPTGEFNTTSFSNSFTVIRDSILTTQVDLSKFLMNRALLLPLATLKPADLGSGDALISAVTQRASAQITANQALQQSMFEKMMLPLMTFFEALMYVAAPFAAILVAFGVGGIGMIGKYLIFALWIQLWKPVAAVGNMFIQMSVTGEMSALSKFALDDGGSLGSLANQPEVFDSLQHWIGVGGMLVASTPMITLMLMYGSAVTASSLAGRIDMGKGSSVGMDDFDGKAQIGAASRSLTVDGQIAAGNDQTTDTTMGAISMAGTMNSQAQKSTALAASHTQAAQTSRGRALEQLTAAGTGVADQNMSGMTAGGRQMGSMEWSEQQTQRLVDSNELSQSDQSLVSAGVNARATGGLNFGKFTSELGKNKINTSKVTGGSAQLGMMMKMLDGKVEGGADYQDKFNQAAAETSKLMDSVDKAWANGQQEGKGWQVSATNSDQDSLTQTQEWKDAAKATEQAQESDTKAKSAEQRASTLKSLAGSTGYQQQYQLATLSADANTPERMQQFGQFLDAKAKQGDTTYAGMQANSENYLKAVRSASANGKVGDMKELLGIAGQNVDDPMVDASVGAMMQQMQQDLGSPQVQGSAPTATGSGPIQSIRNGDGYGLGNLDSSARRQAASAWLDANPDVDRNNMTPEQAQEFLQSVGLAEPGDFSGPETNQDAIDQKVADAKENSDIREVGGKGKDLMDFLDSGVMQQAMERSGEFSQVGAAVGGYAGAVKAGVTAHALKQGGKSVALGMLRGAAGGFFRGGAYGAVIGAAVGAVQGYNAYQDVLSEGQQEQAGQELQSAIQNGGNFTQISEDSQEVINKTLEGVVAKQVEAMAKAGDDFNMEDFRNNELNDFEREIHDSADTLMNAGQVMSDGSSYGDGLGDTFAEAIDQQAENNQRKGQIQRR